MISKQLLKIYYKSIGVVCALILILFILAIITTLISILKINFSTNWSSFFDNWLVLFIKNNIGLISTDELKILHIVDFIIMVLFGYIFIAFFINLWKKKIIWIIFSIIAVISPFLGIVLLYLTHYAGRTGLLTGSLIFSILMLLSKMFKKFTAIIGILASLTLLVSVDYFSQMYKSSTFAIFIIAGYLLWIVWFILIIKEYNKKTIN